MARSKVDTLSAEAIPLPEENEPPSSIYFIHLAEEVRLRDEQAPSMEWADWLSFMASNYLDRAETMWRALLPYGTDIGLHMLRWVEQWHCHPPVHSTHEEDIDGGYGRRVEELESMPYPDYLQSSEWQERRAIVRARFDNRCAVCNDSGRLEIHHRTYVRRGYEDLGDLIALCPDCHGSFHERRGNGSRGLAK